MTLSGNKGKQQRAGAARALRQANGAASAAKHPWLLPLAISIAVVLLVGAVTYAAITGQLLG